MNPGKDHTASSSTGAASSTAAAKKRRTNVGKACLNCRRRKARCDGNKPSCKTCLVYNDECAWGDDDDGRKPASRQYVNSLKNRIKALEAALKEKGQDLPPSADRAGEESEEEDEDEHRDDVAEVSNTMLHLHMGEAGEEVHFHGPTSAYAHSSQSHILSSFDEPLPANLVGRPHDYRRYLPPSVPITWAQHAQILDRFFRYFASWCMRAVPDLFHQDMIRAVTLPPSTHPPRFSHYSPFLHNIILATALRWSDDAELNTLENRLAFAANADFHLARELPRPTLATIQGLGVKSSYHSTLGDHTTGWSYFGMAERTSHSLGLNIDCAALVENAKMSQQEMLLRRNTFWTIFTQEQTWSVYIGRPHAEFEYSTPLPVIDRKLDEMPWTWDNEDGPLKGSPPQNCMFSTTFVETAKLSVIMHRVMTTLYSLKSDIMKLQKDNTLSELGLALDSWNEQLPASLTLSGHSLKNALPHILLLQLSREWLTILIHRPYYRPILTMSRSEKSERADNVFSLAVRRCDRAAARINSLLTIYHERFGLRFSPPTLFNITFTAGTTHLLAAVRHKSQRIKNEAFESANDCVSFLRNVGESWPAARHKAEILEGLVNEYHLTGEDVLASSPETSKSKGRQNSATQPAQQGSSFGTEQHSVFSAPIPMPAPQSVTRGDDDQSVFGGSYEMPPMWAHPMASSHMPIGSNVQQDWAGAAGSSNQYISNSPMDQSSIWALLSSGFGAPTGGSSDMQDPFLNSLLAQMAFPQVRSGASGSTPSSAPIPVPNHQTTPPSYPVGRQYGGFAVADQWPDSQPPDLNPPMGAGQQSSFTDAASYGGYSHIHDIETSLNAPPLPPAQGAEMPSANDLAAFYELLARQAREQGESPSYTGLGVARDVSEQWNRGLTSPSSEQVASDSQGGPGEIGSTAVTAGRSARPNWTGYFGSN